MQALAQKAQDLLAMQATLAHLVACGQGDDRADCPILDTLAAGAGPAAPSV